MRLLLATALAAPLIWSMPSPADAQSFLEGLARRAVDRVAGSATERVEGAIASAVSGEAAPDRENGPGSDSQGERAPGRSAAPAARAASSGPAPWPLNPDDATYTGDLEFDPADEARVKGLEEFAKVRCNDCEGGYAFDSWITHQRGMTVDEVAAAVGALAIGQTLTWTGAESTGVLEVVSEVPVGPFQCKQVRTVMTRGEATYEAPGLYCFGKSHTYAKAMWVEVL